MNILQYFINLYRERKQISLLSWVYGAFAIIFVFIAGIFALVDQSFGIKTLIIPLIAIVAMLANIVIWALIKLVLDTLNEKNEAKSKKSDDKKKNGK